MLTDSNHWPSRKRQFNDQWHSFPILYYSNPVHFVVDTHINSFLRSKHDTFDSHVPISTKESPEARSKPYNYITYLNSYVAQYLLYTLHNLMLSILLCMIISYKSMNQIAVQHNYLLNKFITSVEAKYFGSFQCVIFRAGCPLTTFVQRMLWVASLW
jgi:hypothetical protein